MLCCGLGSDNIVFLISIEANKLANDSKDTGSALFASHLARAEVLISQSSICIAEVLNPTEFDLTTISSLMDGSAAILRKASPGPPHNLNKQLNCSA